jgi:DNA-binding LacI/PurR family transcriptional regulator
MPKRLTIRDIAQAAGVTHGTVSRALNKDPRVKPETMARVQGIAQQMGYVPNLAARHFQRGRTGNIGILCDAGAWMMYNNYFGRIIAGLVEAAQEGGYRNVIYLAKETLPAGAVNLDDTQVELRGLSDMLDGRVDVAVLVGGRHRAHEGLAAVENAGLPLVLAAHNIAVPGHFELRSGAVERMAQATEILIQRQGKAPALLALFKGSTYNQVVQAPWRQAIAAAALAPAPCFEIERSDLAGEANMMEVGQAVFASGAQGLICSDLSQALRLVKLVGDGKLARPEGFELLTFGTLSDRVATLPPWVTCLYADLVAEGGRAFQLATMALEDKPKLAWAMKWTADQ